MENYDALMKELTRLSMEKHAVMKQMQEIEEQLDKIKREKKANALYKEILERFSELVSLGYRIDTAIWENEYGQYGWYELKNNSGDFRLRHKDEVIIG